MKAVYLVKADTAAPRLELATPDRDTAVLSKFVGQDKSQIWPTTRLQLRAVPLAEHVLTFYDLAPGALAFRDAAFQACESFYWLARDYNEFLDAQCGDIPFCVLNPQNLLPPPDDVSGPNPPPCVVDRYYSAIFRIDGRPEDQIFCIEGVTRPLNEFKSVYDFHGFTGLTFTEIWRGEA
jgi:hypothetical protein